MIQCNSQATTNSQTKVNTPTARFNVGLVFSFYMMISTDVFSNSSSLAWPWDIREEISTNNTVLSRLTVYRVNIFIKLVGRSSSLSGSRSVSLRQPVAGTLNIQLTQSVHRDSWHCHVTYSEHG